MLSWQSCRFKDKNAYLPFLLQDVGFEAVQNPTDGQVRMGGSTEN